MEKVRALYEEEQLPEISKYGGEVCGGVSFLRTGSEYR